VSRNIVCGGVWVALAATGCAVGNEAPSSGGDGTSSALGAQCVALDLAAQATQCDAAPPPVTREGFRHERFDDAPQHRGRDMFYREGESQWILAKFAYGVATHRLKDEDVDVFALERCGSEWTNLGRVRTSGSDHGDASVEGFEDDEGRVLFEIPAAERLPIGRHRIRLVVAADGSATELFVEVVPAATKLAVIDIDGTINLGVAREEADKLVGATGAAHDGAPEALTAIAQKGFRPFYLTARADLDIARTRAFIRANGLPEGVIHTTHELTGLFGKPATTFKEQDLAFQTQRGLDLAIAFGNQESDADAYEAAGVARASRFYFQFDDARYGGRRVDSWRDVIPEFRALDSGCAR
jgi:hypothetical protein